MNPGRPLGFLIHLGGLDLHVVAPRDDRLIVLRSEVFGNPAQRVTLLRSQTPKIMPSLIINRDRGAAYPA
jgi:hypothetical protein